MPSRREPPSTVRILASTHYRQLLEAVGAGDVTRDGPGLQAGYWWRGGQVGVSSLRTLANAGLVWMPLSGSPRLTEDGVVALDGVTQ